MSERAPGYTSRMVPGADTLRLMAIVFDEGCSPFVRELVRKANISKPDRLFAGVFKLDRATVSQTAMHRSRIPHDAVNRCVTRTWSKTARWAAAGQDRQTFHDNMKRELETIIRTSMQGQGVDPKEWQCEYRFCDIKIPGDEPEKRFTPEDLAAEQWPPERLTIDKPLSAAGSRSVARATETSADAVSLKITVKPFKYDTSQVQSGRKGRKEHPTDHYLGSKITSENETLSTLGCHRFHAIESILEWEIRTSLSYPMIMSTIEWDINKYGSFVKEQIESLAETVRRRLYLSEKAFSYEVVVPQASIPDLKRSSRSEEAEHSTRLPRPSVLVEGTVEYTDEFLDWLAEQYVATFQEYSQAPEGSSDPPEESKHSFSGLSSY